MPRLAASVEMMFRERDLLDRFGRAAAAGFRGVEVQSPYGETKEDIAGRARRHQLEVVLMNLRTGVAAIPGREDEFRAELGRGLEYARAAGCRQLHCPAGATDHPAAEETFVANLEWAASQAQAAGVRLLLEPLNTRDNPGYFLTGTAQARRIIDRVGRDNVRLQYDFYHRQIMEGCLAETLKAQLEADEAQEINYPYLLDLLDDLGYEGWVGCEYRPRGETLAGLGWAHAYGIEITSTPSRRTGRGSRRRGGRRARR
jgi:hydroxypyruvate isomerase